MELIVQPSDGLKPTLSAVERAKSSLDIVIFRFDLKALEKAIEAAVKRGVAVRALIAHTNRRLRNCADRLAQDSMGDDEDGVVVVEEALRAGIEDVCIVVCPGDEAAYRKKYLAIYA